MAKKKKTRKQKALSDLRHNATRPKREISSSSTLPETDESPRDNIFTYALQTSHVKTPVATKVISPTENHYITHDLKKTALLTLAIMTSQLILYFLLNRP